MKCRSLLVAPPAFTVWTFLVDAPAVGAMVKVAVTVLSFTTWRLLTVTPEPDTAKKLVPVRWLPVRVTLKAAPPRCCDAGTDCSQRGARYGEADGGPGCRPAFAR